MSKKIREPSISLHEMIEPNNPESENLIQIENDSLEVVSKTKGTTNVETVMLIIKANIGSGILAMPFAFKNAGLLITAISLWIMGAICVNCMHVLINSYKYIKINYSKRNEKLVDCSSYEDVVYLVAKEKCDASSSMPKYIKILTSCFLILSQFGCGCIYLVFIATNIKQVVDFYYPSNAFNIQLIMLFVLMPLLVYFLINDLKILAPFSAFANALIVFSILVILYDLFLNGSFKPYKDLEMVAPYHNWPICFSLALYAFEGIPLVLPVYNEMRSKTSFTPLYGVLNLSMAIVAVMYFIIGFFGYLKYGSDSQASITLNLPIKDKIFQIVKLLYALAIFISYNLQFSIASNTIWSYIYESSSYLKSLKPKNKTIDPLDSSKSQTRVYNLIHNLFRSGLVVLSFILAITIPKIELFISLFGAIAASTLAIIIPTVLDLVLFWPLSKYSFFKLYKNFLFLLFGVYVFVAGIYVSVLDIYIYFKN